MRIKRPIFIGGLSRGGTTQLLNLVGSHPDVAMVGETHKVFKGCRQNDSLLRVAAKGLLRDLPVLTVCGMDYFSPRCETPRPPLPRLLRNHVDRCLRAESLRRHPNLNRDKAPGERYTRAELLAARIVGKNLDGAVFLNDILQAAYPDATFISLVRHGLAVCEGHLRRGVPAWKIGRRYQLLMSKLLDDADDNENHLVVRFEDLLRRPADVMVDCCRVADLDVWRIGPVRLQTRKLLQDDGGHRAAGKEWQVVWASLSELASHYDAEIDARQISNLGDQDRNEFLGEAWEVMSRLGYSSLPPVERAG